MIVSEIYLIGIQRTNDNWNYARKRQDNSIEFVPFNEWNRDVVCFQSKEDAEAFKNVALEIANNKRGEGFNNLSSSFYFYKEK